MDESSVAKFNAANRLLVDTADPGSSNTVVYVLSTYAEVPSLQKTV